MTDGTTTQSTSTAKRGRKPSTVANKVFTPTFQHIGNVLQINANWNDASGQRNATKIVLTVNGTNLEVRKV